LTGKITYEIREMREEDVPGVLELVKGLAEYEKLLPQVTATLDLYKKNGFGENRYFRALVVQGRQRLIGFALYFFTFSTFLGKPSLYLEDLFVLPEYRGYGIGKDLLIKLAGIAFDRDCGRMEWSVLNWNEPAIGFYRRLGAQPLSDWTVYRLLTDDIRKLAEMEH
jgi:ribosomal protein S18 acetylase RimI-like enzyme